MSAAPYHQMFVLLDPPSGLRPSPPGVRTSSASSGTWVVVGRLVMISVPVRVKSLAKVSCMTPRWVPPITISQGPTGEFCAKRVGAAGAPRKTTAARAAAFLRRRAILFIVVTTGLCERPHQTAIILHYF